MKVRMQLAGEGGGQKGRVGEVVKNLLAEGGVKQLHAGLSAALLRQVFYGSSRLGLFSLSTDFFQERNNGKSLPFYMKIGLALGSGGMAAVIGTPFDLALVRMASDGKLPVDQQKKYTSAFDAVGRVARSEGVLGL